MARVSPAEYLRVLLRARNPELADRIRSLDDVHRLQDVTLPGYNEADSQLVRASWKQLYDDARTGRLFGYPVTGVDQMEIGETDKEVGELHIWNETLSRDGRVIFTHVRFLLPEQPKESPPPSGEQPTEPPVADPVPVASEAAPAKNPGGRPAIAPQDKVDAEVFRLMRLHGEFAADNPDWDSQARLEDAIGDFCETLTGKRPKETTLKNYVKEPLRRWREGSET
jgi:hypothetical protein